jgi:hypothetical protein
MSVGRGMSQRGSSMLFVFLFGLSVAYPVRQVQAETCVLETEHAGVTFSVQKVAPEWTCRLQSIITDYTTANKVGPIQAAIPESMYRYLLDRPPLAAGLINRLDLGLYKAERRGPDRYWGNDGEGTEGLVELVYQDRISRIYYLEGTHYSRLLPNMTGKAVLLLRMTPVKLANGAEAMDSTMVSYVKLSNPVVTGLLSLLRPLIGGTISRKLAKGVKIVNRLGLEMRDHPERVLFEATDPPPFADEDIAFLIDTLKSQLHPSFLDQLNPPKP